jgi:hypothetical protein
MGFFPTYGVKTPWNLAINSLKVRYDISDIQRSRD